MKTKFRRLACACLTAVMTVSFTAGNALAFAQDSESGSSVVSGRLDTVEFEKVTGQVDISSIVLQNLSSQVLENAGYTVKNDTRTVIVTLEGDSLIESMPEGENVSEFISSYAGSKVLKSVNQTQTNFLNSLRSMGVDYNVVYQYNTVTNAVAIEVNTAYLSTIKSISSVKTAVVSETYAAPKTVETTSTGATSNPSNVYATGIYDSEEVIEKYDVDGSGVTVAILDTGLDYTHEAFSVMPENVSFTKDYVSGKLSSSTFNAVSLSAQKGKNITADDLYINAKVPFAYDYADKDADVYPSYSQHGTHVAGIIAGQADSYTDKDGNIATDSDGNVLSFRGVAPNAQLVICKVFTDDLESEDLGGATSEDILAALEDCVRLGVDIINMSLGTTSGFSSLYLDGDDEGQALYTVYNSIKAAGISLICAASNDYSSGFGSVFGTNLASNPDSGTVGSPSTFDGALSVASINGQLSPFMVANDTAIFYTESTDANSVKYNFAEQILEGKQSQTFKYVVVPGIGQAADYTGTIQSLLNDKSEGKVIAVIKRGTTTFQDKVEIAMRMGADAVIIYNNVAGTVGMTLGDLEDPVPTVSVTMDAGRALCYDANGRALTTGYLEVNTAYQAGPFMNEYSSWGATPSLGLKPEITSHGGEITSTVSGGYAEMSGTSMASPNLAGFVALLKDYLKQQFPDMSATELTRLTNQIVMSTATTIYDQEGLPYSPRKQGAGLATLANVFSTNAYLYTIESEGGAEDNRPKIELGEDEDKTGVYNLTFYVQNFGSQALSFTAKTIFMTETLSSDGLAVAEKAYLLDDIPAAWTVNGAKIADGGEFTVAAGQSAAIRVTLTLSDEEKAYIDASFRNGMYVEGFLKLVSVTEGQCDLVLPFMGFYGDWEAAPMLDYDCFEIAESAKDTSLKDEEKLQPMVWATQAYAMYYNEKYSIPMGNYLYLQDEFADQIYTDEEHAAISCYNLYYGEDSYYNYMTATSIKALYAGLLRNAELVTYDLYDAVTGELIKQGNDYRISKAYAGGGSSVPAQVLLELYPEELGLVNNGKYKLDFHFYMKAEDAENPEKQNDDNTFSMVFYVDYEAPILVDSRIRYYDYKDGTKDKQRVYLDLDIYDNHYAQSVILCYSEKETDDVTELKLATEYVTPVYNANKNGTTTVSIEITDFYEKYQSRLYVQIDDYALNHNVYSINFSSSSAATLPDTFEIAGDTEITIGVNETYKVALTYEGSASLSNFTWTSSPQYVAQVKNGEIFGASVGTSTVTVTGLNGVSRKITVHVVESNTTLTWPSISFGTVENSEGSIVKAAGTVKVNAGENFKLELVVDPWYYDASKLTLNWSSSDESIATVDQNGNVKTFDTKGTAIIKATIMNGDVQTPYSATVILSVQEPFTVSNYTLTDYHGMGGTVVIPDDKNIMTIGEEAFKDNDNIKVIIIPKTVTTISERAFINCTALEEVYFIQQEPMAIADADLSLIERHAFSGCTSLRKVDFSNVKTITIDKEVFLGCTALEEVVKMQTIGTMNDRAFAGCTSLLSADITGLHMSGTEVFAGCTALKEIKTAYYTAIGESMFRGCTALTSVVINTPTVAENAFYGCGGLQSVTFGSAGDSLTFSIGAKAFYNCPKLKTVNFNGNAVSSIGDMAFAECSSLTEFTIPAGGTLFGDRVFNNSPVTVNYANGSGYSKDSYGAIYNGTTLVLAPKNITSSFVIKSGTTEIAPYAFSGCTLTGITEIAIPSTVTKIGEGAFAYSQIKSVTIPSGVTEIADYAFQGTLLEAITVPAQIIRIGAGAFTECANLKTVSFAAGSKLAQIGSAAFLGCTSLTGITLPDGAAVMGDSIFAGCTSLSSVTLPSVTELGFYTFWNCPALTTVKFGANASASGSYTFYPGGSLGTTFASSLTSVTLGGNMTELGEGVFYYCKSLGSIDLKNITVIGAGAFANCTSLDTVTGLDKVTEIGRLAFANTALTSLNLGGAKVIGDSAFYAENGEAAYTAVNIPVVTEIGSYAFYGGSETLINLPASLKSVGYAAFAGSRNLASINVDGANKIFFSEDGVLYRYVVDHTAENTVQYELCAYPAAKIAQADENGVKTYSVKEGTVSIMAFAFCELNSGAIKKVVLPYSVKVIGDAAFWASGISEYRFESINAPTLLTEYLDTGITAFYSIFYLNFEDDLLGHLSDMVVEATPSELRIGYPDNGIGYDNYIYSNYFGTVIRIGELIDDTTRGLKEMIESFVSADTVKGWNSLEVNAANTAMVTEFSEQVKEAHRIYNTVTDATQLGFLGADNIKKLTDIETELKPVKTRFGISVNVASLAVSPDSSHKTAYKAGETFDMTGLKLTVTYDDYSTETVDSSALKLSSAYAGELTALNRYVVVEYNGKTVQVAITVTADGGNEGGNGEIEKSGCAAGCGSVAFGEGGGMTGGLIAIGLVACALVILVVRKKKVN